MRASCRLALARAFAVQLLGLGRHRLGVLAVADLRLDVLLGLQRLLGQRLHRDQVVGGLLALLGDLGRRLLDLVLVDLQQHLGRAQVVVLVVLTEDQRAVGLALPGDVGGRLRVEDRGERQQGGVTLLVDVGDRVDHQLLLGRQGRLAGGHVGLGLREPGLGRGEGGLHLLVLLLRDLEPGPYVAQLGARLDQLLAGPGQGPGGAPERGARLLQRLVGLLDLVLGLLLLVAQLAGARLRAWEGEDADRDGERGRDRGHASTTDAGEGTHLFAFGCSGK